MDIGEEYIRKLIDDVNSGLIDVNQEKPVVSLPLIIALSIDNLELAVILLEKGADPRKKNSYGLSPMDIALKQGKLEFIELFQKYNNTVENSINVNIEENSRDIIIQYFMEDIDKRNIDIRTSFWPTFKRDMTMGLIKKENYQKYLDMKLPPRVVWERYVMEVFQLIKNGEVDVNDSNHCFLLACVYYDLDVTPFLELGADPYLKNKDGVSAYSYCIEQGLLEYLDIFENCKLNTKEPSA